MENRELEQLTKDILVLEKERDEINRIFNQTDVPYDDIKVLSDACFNKLYKSLYETLSPRYGSTIKEYL